MAENKERYRKYIANILTDVFYLGGQTGEFKWTPDDSKIFPCKQVGKSEVFDNSWPFLTKCSGQTPSLFSALYSEKSEAQEFIKDIAEESSIKGKIPQVIFPISAVADIVMIPAKAFFMLQDVFGTPSFNFLRVYEGQNIGFVFLPLIPFLDWIDWTVFCVKSGMQYIKSLVKE